MRTSQSFCSKHLPLETPPSINAGSEACSAASIARNSGAVTYTVSAELWTSQGIFPDTGEGSSARHNPIRSQHTYRDNRNEDWAIAYESRR